MMAQQLLLPAANEQQIEAKIEAILASRQHCNASGQAGEYVHLIRAQLSQKSQESGTAHESVLATNHLTAKQSET
ncbi:hypothetical protein HZS93_07112 (plasmid) [Xanthomonas citri]|nr:hypothetical protein HZS93_07112 [Xanthomonas citri]